MSTWAAGAFVAAALLGDDAEDDGRCPVAELAARGVLSPEEVARVKEFFPISGSRAVIRPHSRRGPILVGRRRILREEGDFQNFYNFIYKEVQSYMMFA